MRELNLAKGYRALAAAIIISVFGNGALAQDAPRIVTVNYPLQYFAERLVGDAAEVVFPVPEGVDPSFWRPSISDISAVQSADLILLNGAGFATWVDRVSLPRARLVDTSRSLEDQFIVTESITHSHGDGGAHSHEGLASYTWLDPTLAIAQAEAVAAALTVRDLAPAGEIETRLGTLRAELGALDTKARADLSAAQGVAMIATHPRYQYLARRYDLSIASLEWEAGAEPTADEWEELDALMKETGARILIWEGVPPAAALEAAEALGVENVVFETLAHKPSNGSYVDALGAAIAALSDVARHWPGN
ncbi:MAG: metal ABC transporter substrate-binding protein [Pseudomonadota bacterium]